MKKVINALFMVVFVLLFVSCGNDVNVSSATAKGFLDIRIVNVEESSTRPSLYGGSVSADAGTIYKMLTIGITNNSNEPFTYSYLGDTISFRLNLANGHSYPCEYADLSVKIMPSMSAEVKAYFNVIEGESLTNALLKCIYYNGTMTQQYRPEIKI